MGSRHHHGAAGGGSSVVCGGTRQFNYLSYLPRMLSPNYYFSPTLLLTTSTLRTYHLYFYYSPTYYFSATLLQFEVEVHDTRGLVIK